MTAVQFWTARFDEEEVMLIGPDKDGDYIGMRKDSPHDEVGYRAADDLAGLTPIDEVLPAVFDAASCEWLVDGHSYLDAEVEVYERRVLHWRSILAAKREMAARPTPEQEARISAAFSAVKPVWRLYASGEVSWQELHAALESAVKSDR